MGFKNGAFATCWEVKSQNDRWTKVRISISHKDQQGDDYITDFSGWVDVYGTAAAAKAAKLKNKDRIKLTSVDLTNNYNKEKKETFWNPKVFDFEMAGASGGGGNSGGRTQQRSAPAPQYEGENDYGDDLPF